MSSPEDDMGKCSYCPEIMKCKFDALSAFFDMVRDGAWDEYTALHPDVDQFTITPDQLVRESDESSEKRINAMKRISELFSGCDGKGSGPSKLLGVIPVPPLNVCRSSKK